MCTEAAIGMVAELRLTSMRVDIMIGVSAVEMLGVSVDMLANIGIIVVPAPEMGFDLLAKVSYALEVCAGAIIAGTPDIGVEMNANGLAAVMTGFKRAVAAPFIEPFRSC